MSLFTKSKPVYASPTGVQIPGTLAWWRLDDNGSGLTLTLGGDGYITPIGHYLVKIEGADATDTLDGFKDAYKCSRCGKYFEDTDGKVEIGDVESYNTWKLSTGKIEATAPNNNDNDNNNDNNNDSNNDDNKGLSTGAVIGITACSIIGACLISYFVMFIVWKEKIKH